MLVFHFGASLSSAGLAIGSPVAVTVSSVTLVDAGVVVSAGTALWTSLNRLWGLQVDVSLANDQCNFMGDAPSDGHFVDFGLWMMVLLLGC